MEIAVDLGDSVLEPVRNSIIRKALGFVSRFFSLYSRDPIRRSTCNFIEDSVWYSVWYPVYNSACLRIFPSRLGEAWK